MSGCASTAQELVDCTTISCVDQQTAKTIARQCRADLNDHHMMSMGEKRRVNATYRYPLTNEKTYINLLRTGSVGPSPYTWCRRYARWRLGAVS
ncbi:MAG: hypothetical protein AAF513_10210 [Pseudomonadota bacterium]